MFSYIKKLFVYPVIICVTISCSPGRNNTTTGSGINTNTNNQPIITTDQLSDLVKLAKSNGGLDIPALSGVLVTKTVNELVKEFEDDKQSKIPPWANNPGTLEIVFNSRVQTRLVEFAKDNKATGNIHLQNAASQFNSIELKSNKDSAIPTDAAKEYPTDKTQGPYAQLANPYNAQRLLDQARTSNNRAGFSGLKDLKLIKYEENGYLLHGGDAVKHTEIADELKAKWGEIIVPASINMPVYGNIESTSTYKYFNQPLGNVSLVFVSAVPSQGAYTNTMPAGKEQDHDLIQATTLLAGFEATIVHGLNQWIDAIENKTQAQAPKLFIHLTLPGTGVFMNDPNIVYWALSSVLQQYLKFYSFHVTIEIYSSSDPDILKWEKYLKDGSDMPDSSYQQKFQDLEDAIHP